MGITGTSIRRKITPSLLSLLIFFSEWVLTTIRVWNPVSIINPVYNGCKSWIHSFTTNLRTQLAAVDSKIKVVEIVPPTVETALHRDRKNPDDNKRAQGNQSALSVQEFMDDISKGWEENQDVCTAGPGHGIVKALSDAMAPSYEKVGKQYIEGVRGT